jgi:hypothetical protein
VPEGTEVVVSGRIGSDGDGTPNGMGALGGMGGKEEAATGFEEAGALALVPLKGVGFFEEIGG